MTDVRADASGVPEIDLTDAEVLRDPAAAYGRVRERSPLARLRAPGMRPMWVLTRHEDARAMLSDPRFELSADSFMRPAGIPEHCLAYMRTMQRANPSPPSSSPPTATRACSPTPNGWTSAARQERRDISDMLTGHTSVSGPRWLGHRPRSRSPHCCAASPVWRSPAPRGASPTRARGAWRHCPSPSDPGPDPAFRVPVRTTVEKRFPSGTHR